MSKVLFLDIDGVVNKQDNWDRSKGLGPFPIDSYCAFLVGRIQIATGCDVVLSSSWRHHPEAIEKVRENIVPLIGITPTLMKKYDPPVFARGRNWDYSLRGDEVEAWLMKYPEVTEYAILDDDSDFYDDQPLFKTSFKTGLTEEIANQVIEHLNKGDKDE